MRGRESGEEVTYLSEPWASPPTARLLHLDQTLRSAPDT